MIILTATLVILHITKTESNNCFVIDFKPQIINIARKTIKTYVCTVNTIYLLSFMETPRKFITAELSIRKN